MTDGSRPARAPRDDDPDDDDGPDLWDDLARWLAARGAPLVVLALTVVMAWIYAGVFRGEPAGDDLTFHMAESARIADCLRALDFDLWNPSANGGYASAYYYQVIPQLASAIPSALFGHHLFWFQLSVVVPLVLTPLAAYRGIRLLGASPWQAAVATLTLSFTIGASRWGYGADGTFSVGLYTQTWAFAVFPLALGHAARWATTGRGLAPAVAWSALVGLCHPFAVIALGLTLMFGFVATIVAHAFRWGRSAPRRRGVARTRGDVANLIGLATLVGYVTWGIAYALGRAAAAAGLVAPTPDDPRLIRQFVRLAVLAALLAIALASVLLPLGIDYAGFGGFPHRVADEVGPGFKLLWSWFEDGMILDHERVLVLTVALPVAFVFGRAPLLSWLWVGAFVFATLLGLGPHLGKSQDDLFPMVRFLGAMQLLLGIGIGLGLFSIGAWWWRVRPGSTTAVVMRVALVALLGIGGPLLAGYALWFAEIDGRLLTAAARLTPGVEDPELVRLVAAIGLAVIPLVLALPVWRALDTQIGLRTALAVIVTVLVALTVVDGVGTQRRRVRVLADSASSHRAEMMQVIAKLATEPPGRKQVGPGCENHWWNLLTYVYARVPSTLQLGGGGLQASPVFDFMWWNAHNFARTAWVFDAPYLAFDKGKAATMPVGETVIQTSTYLVRRLPSPGLVSPVEITGALPPGPAGPGTEVRKKALAWLKSDDALEDRHLAYAGHGPPGTPPDATVHRAWRTMSPGDHADIHAEVEARAPTTLVVRETWHPRWHAYLDGREVRVRRVTPDFPAIDVPPGKHLLQLRFERPWWALASWLAWPLATLAGWWLARRVRYLGPAI